MIKQDLHQAQQEFHIGGARQRCLTTHAAYGGVFVPVLKIQILNGREEYTKDILEGLWLVCIGMKVSNFKRRGWIYTGNTLTLSMRKAYKCYCSTETLEEKRKAALREGRKPNYDRTCRDLTEDRKDQPFVIRFKSPVNGEVSFDDRIRGRITFKCEELDDLVILRTDNTPTYNFTVVVDDALMGITSIIRGDDHINNTPRQILIYEALNYETPEFAHVPLIHGKDKSRLSKRHGATSLLEYRNDGFLPEALMNYLARLGWAHGDQEVFSREDLIEKFDLGKVGKSPSIFDMDKLLWLNGHYLKTMPEGDIAARLEPFIENRGIKVTDKNKLIPVVINLRDRAKTLREMAEMAAFFFTDDFPYDENAKNKFLTVSTKPILERFLNEFTSVSSFDENEQRKLFETMAQDGGKKLVEVIQPVRVALCGRTVSPGIFEVVSILGRDSVVKRIKKAIASIA